MKKVSVVIPSFNAVQLLQKNLPAVLAAVNSGDEVIVVDDAGTDETHSWMISEFKLAEVIPEIQQVPADYFPNPNEIRFEIYSGSLAKSGKNIFITLLRLRKNLRFAGAVNMAALIAKNELLFLCNNDVIPEKDCLNYLLPHFENTTTFAVGCLEYEDSKQGQKSGKNILYFEQGIFKHNRERDFITGETAWASGGSAVFDKAKWLELRGFDQAFYPAYWEDIDLSFRARKKGWDVLFEESAIVYHKHESTNADVFGQKKIQQMSWKNAFAFSWKNSSLQQRLQFLLWLPYWMYKSR